MISVGAFTSVQVNVDAQGNNIVGDATNDPSIAIDPNDLNKMAIGWRRFDTVESNFREAGVAYSQDGGQTWTFTGVLEEDAIRSDPILATDADGKFYYSSLILDYTIKAYGFKSIDGGENGGPPAFAYGGDKESIAIDGRRSLVQAAHRHHRRRRHQAGDTRCRP